VVAGSLPQNPKTPATDPLIIQRIPSAFRNTNLPVAILKPQ
jgi:hypothetical protein